MAISSPSDLFLYDLSSIYDAEKKAAEWKDQITGQLRGGDLQQILRAAQQDGQQRIKNLESCFQALRSRPGAVRNLIVDGIGTEFQQFMNQQPTSEALETYVVGSLLKLSWCGVGSYRGLVDKATTMGQSQCAQTLQSNLVMKEEETGRLERVSHEMNQRVMATA